MRFSTFLTLAAAPLLALAAPQQQQQNQDAPLITASPESHSTASLPTQTVAPGDAWNAEASGVVLEPGLRQEANLLATKATGQVPATQNYWIADHWDSVQSTEIWSQIFYSQTFVSAPGQLTTAGAGEIGLGTHTGEIGVAKAATGAGASVMPQGSLLTAVLGLAGVAAGMGVVLL
ncbi:unnamed protein product [Aureobasidium vineae]|uniref:Uncharacterized protein n=1 Tax=Aureobasidium vineae TaxID=2773715 RepID=A0A9N8P545_9PEZI|nr:unnamed protein product [Aureobasidium vineae]